MTSELEKAVERLTADLTEPFGHFAGEAPESCALVRIEDARLILSANREMRAALERIASGLPGVRAVHRFTEAQLTARSALTTQRGDGE